MSAARQEASEARVRWLGSLSRRAQRVGGQRRGTRTSPHVPRRPLVPKLPRLKTAAPHSGCSQRELRARREEPKLIDDAAWRRKRRAERLASIERSNEEQDRVLRAS